MITGVYKIYWEDAPYFYIGQSLNIAGRFKCHLSSLKRGKHASNKLQQAFNKHGKPKVTILETCAREYLDLVEMTHIGSHNEKFSCNINGAVPVRMTPIKFKKEDHLKLSALAQKSGFDSVIKLVHHLAISAIK